MFVICVTIPVTTTGTNTCYTYNTTGTLQPCIRICYKELKLSLVPNQTLFPPNQFNNISGSCPSKINQFQMASTLKFHWANSSSKFELSFNFRLNLVSTDNSIFSTQDVWYLDMVNFTVNETHSYQYLSSSRNPNLYAHARQYYECVAPLTVPLLGHKSHLPATLTITNIVIQPFNLSDTNFEFKYSSNCLNKGIPFYIPMTVSGILATFVLFLFFCFLTRHFFRKKHRRYERLIPN